MRRTESTEKSGQPNIPTIDELSGELRREKYRSRYRKVFRSTLYALIIVSAVSVLIATLLLPVLQIYGKSMNPTLYEGDIVVSVKSGTFSRGDIIAFYFNNSVLVKRIIGCPGDVITIDEDGNVYVNNSLLKEDYISEKSYGSSSNIEYPYNVPENSYFVLGDNREKAVDSRDKRIGCVEQSEIVGKIVFRVWPLKSFGGIK